MGPCLTRAIPKFTSSICLYQICACDFSDNSSQWLGNPLLNGCEESFHTKDPTSDDDNVPSDFVGKLNCFCVQRSCGGEPLQRGVRRDQEGKNCAYEANDAFVCPLCPIKSMTKYYASANSWMGAATLISCLRVSAYSASEKYLKVAGRMIPRNTRRLTAAFSTSVKPMLTILSI